MNDFGVKNWMLLISVSTNKTFYNFSPVSAKHESANCPFFVNRVSDNLINRSALLEISLVLCFFENISSLNFE